MMEVRIAELERRNTELEDHLHRGSDPLELRLQHLAEESSQLQKKLRVSYVINYLSNIYAVVSINGKLTEGISVT